MSPFAVDAATIPYESTQGARSETFCHNSFSFPDISWCGGQHDEYGLAKTLSAYVWIRLPATRSGRDVLALLQSAFSFGLLEIITGFKVPESLLLAHRADGTLVLSSERVTIVLARWLLGPLRASMSHRTASDIHWMARADDAITSSRLAIDELRTGRGLVNFGDEAPTQDEIEETCDSLAAFVEAISRLLTASFRAVSTLHQAPEVPMPTVWPLRDSEFLALWAVAAERFSRLISTSQDPRVYNAAFADLFHVVHLYDFLDKVRPSPLQLLGSSMLPRAMIRICENPDILTKPGDPEAADLALALIQATRPRSISFRYQGESLQTGSSPGPFSGHSHRAASEFVDKLCKSWKLHEFTMGTADWSPMPWSARSRKEGIPPSPESLDHNAPVVDVPSEASQPHSQHDDLFYFMDMPWLGGLHDGHPRATSLSAYVWIRLPAVRAWEENVALWRNTLS